jgi:Mrp family chromosome partitioning ATPase/capsular polysaccharide biosynthesis protein
VTEDRRRPAGAGQRDGERSLLLRGLRRYWWIPPGALVLFAVLGGALSVTRGQAEYRSTSSVVVKGFDSLSGQLSGADGTQDPNKTVATLRQLVRIDEVAAPVAAAVGLPVSERTEVQKRTTVGTQVDSDLITISVTWPDRALSQRLAQASAEEFVAYRTRLDTAPLLAAQRNLRARIAEAEAQGAKTYVDRLVETDLDLRTRIAAGSYNSAVAARASDPVQVAPTPAKSAILFGIAGAALGLFLVALLQAADRRVRSAADAEAQLGSRTLVTIPRPRASDGAMHLVMLSDPAGAGADPYRALATSLDVAGGGVMGHTVLVVSSTADAGAPATCANVAIAAARSGRLVVVCDLNFRRPLLGELFGLGRSFGVGDVLTGTASVEEALTQVKLATAGPRRRRRTPRIDESGASPTSGLWVMPGGPPPGAPADMAGSVRLAALIASLREQFELVLLTAPPWSTASDALAVGRHADTVLPVVAGGSSRAALSSMREGLRQLPVQVVGMVFTDGREGPTAFPARDGGVAGGGEAGGAGARPATRPRSRPAGRRTESRT